MYAYVRVYVRVYVRARACVCVCVCGNVTCGLRGCEAARLRPISAQNESIKGTGNIEQPSEREEERKSEKEKETVGLEWLVGTAATALITFL